MLPMPQCGFDRYQMGNLFTFRSDGRNVACVGVLVDSIENQHLSNGSLQNERNEFQKFVVRRAHNAFGKWPVHLITKGNVGEDSTQFSGFRIFAKCCAICPDDPEMVEYGILVWHATEIDIDPRVPEIADLKWAAFAECLEI